MPAGVFLCLLTPRAHAALFSLSVIRAVANPFIVSPITSLYRPSLPTAAHPPILHPIRPPPLPISSPFSRRPSSPRCSYPRSLLPPRVPPSPVLLASLSFLTPKHPLPPPSPSLHPSRSPPPPLSVVVSFPPPLVSLPPRDMRLLPPAPSFLSASTSFTPCPYSFRDPSSYRPYLASTPCILPKPRPNPYPISPLVLLASLSPALHPPSHTSPPRFLHPARSPLPRLFFSHSVASSRPRLPLPSPSLLLPTPSVLPRVPATKLALSSAHPLPRLFLHRVRSGALPLPRYSFPAPFASVSPPLQYPHSPRHPHLRRLLGLASSTAPRSPPSAFLPWPRPPRTLLPGLSSHLVLLLPRRPSYNIFLPPSTYLSLSLATPSPPSSVSASASTPCPVSSTPFPPPSIPPHPSISHHRLLLGGAVGECV
ncbi:hypothetical protein C8R44DRAFT_768933 [Mycena epipterygia]|nr:hypothetical protein C8R44DRAFT_768933 [Mycena epipterygia]